MATLKLKPKPPQDARERNDPAAPRPPVRGAAPRRRPTAAQADAERRERAAQRRAPPDADHDWRPVPPADRPTRGAPFGDPPRDGHGASSGDRMHGHRGVPSVDRLRGGRGAPSAERMRGHRGAPSAERARGGRSAPAGHAMGGSPGQRGGARSQGPHDEGARDGERAARPGGGGRDARRGGGGRPPPSPPFSPRPDRPSPQPNVGRAARPLTPPLTPPQVPTDWRTSGTDDRPPGTAGLAARLPSPAAAPGRDAADGIRLSKRMSALGIASRREADEWIPKGWVRVDGRVVDQLGARVQPGQHITVDARARYVQAQKVTVLLHKPVGYVSGQAEDGHTPAVALFTPERQWRQDGSGTRYLPAHQRGLAPAGRLDIDSTGLLVLTQDGRVARQLIGDDSTVEKEYLVHVAMAGGGRLPDEGLALLRHGLSLDGVALRPAQVGWIDDDRLRFVLVEGRKRQIRRMCEAVGLQVLGLQRVRIGAVELGDLPPGQWRYLRGDEVFAAMAR